MANLTFVSGLIGNGKTLWVISTIDKLSKAEGRAVYAYGIPELTLPWLPLDLAPSGYTEKEVKEKRYPANVPDWRAVPEGSIVVIDEAWEFFPKRPPGHKPPEYVEQLANVRRRGIQLFLITQNPKDQVDTFVRGVADRHVFLERKFGATVSRVYDWQKVEDQNSSSAKEKSESKLWTFPKEYYGTYKSAELHTTKAKLPMRKLLTLGGCLVGVVLCFFFAVRYLTNSGDKKIAVDSSGRASGSVSAPLADFWVRGRVERVGGIPASAPVYDELQKVRSQPRPEGCMQIAVGKTVRCECTGPNHSVLEMSLSKCMDLVKRGWFDETRSYPDVKAENVAALKRSEGTGSDSGQASAAVKAAM